LELEEAVEKEVGRLASKNAARKQEKAIAQNESDMEKDNSLLDSRWEAVQEFISKWEPKLKRWDELMDRLEFEEIVVEEPTAVGVESTRTVEKEPKLLKESGKNPALGKDKADQPDDVGGIDAESSSSSVGGETGTSDREEGEVDRAPLEQEDVSDDGNDRVGVVETDFRPSCKQVADHIESQRREAAQRKSSGVQKKLDVVGISTQRTNALPKQVGVRVGKRIHCNSVMMLDS
jgi:hypothetical protein